MFSVSNQDEFAFKTNKHLETTTFESELFDIDDFPVLEEREHLWAFGLTPPNQQLLQHTSNPPTADDGCGTPAEKTRVRKGEATSSGVMPTTKKRTIITPEQRRQLLDKFRDDPYPDEKAMEDLSKQLRHSVRTIRNWFVNTRSRCHKIEESSSQTASIPTLNHSNRISSPPANITFDKRPDTPTTKLEEAWPGRGRTPTPPIDVPATRRDNSQASSVGSIASFESLRSVDSRGSRKGRRSWATRTPIPAKRKPAGRYFCTYPRCDRSFHHRFEWERHEEAVHYCPYHWTCCSEQGVDEIMKHCFVCDKPNVPLRHIHECHFSTCAKKPVKERMFFRRDQIQQHIKRHLTFVGSRHLAAPDALLESWRCENASLGEAALRCGFCGCRLSTWAARNDHVFRHFQAGLRKSQWNPETTQHGESPAGGLTPKSQSSQPLAVKPRYDMSSTIEGVRLASVSWLRRRLYNRRLLLRITCSNCEQDFTQLPPEEVPSFTDCTSRLCREPETQSDPENLTLSPGEPYKIQCRSCDFLSMAGDETLPRVLYQSQIHAQAHTG
ncbi:hypothetical protein FB567DRAFT_317574 [Paraphoma chrysanthemicola]|uniref:Homeobox domain-containing protein n=1 Tax=Paraphoma chrysanthemicola TaxID=798071 RepID=A0A8K0R8Y1_9PLEO|nr:hypothetical protein FB567DRAFT_317574 [Paraphoma chrysanthemicola]